MKIILFDGFCNLCDKSVQFIIDRDRNGTFHFASLQSDTGRKLLQKYQVTEEVTSVVLVDNNTVYVQSDAALRICKHLTRPWNYLYLAIIIPKRVRDTVYRFIAKHRYRWFGKKNSCMLPTPEIKKRFLE